MNLAILLAYTFDVDVSELYALCILFIVQYSHRTELCSKAYMDRKG